MRELDPNIKALMTETVIWEQFASMDVYGDQSYSPGIPKLAWVEAHGMFGGGVVLRETKDERTQDAMVDIYFDAADPDVLAFDVKDRFTVTNLDDRASYSLTPDSINTWHGPDGNPWVRVVSL